MLTSTKTLLLKVLKLIINYTPKQVARVCSMENVSILADTNSSERLSANLLEIQRQKTVPGESLSKDIGRYVKTNAYSFDEGDNIM